MNVHVYCSAAAAAAAAAAVVVAAAARTHGKRNSRRDTRMLKISERGNAGRPLSQAAPLTGVTTERRDSTYTQQRKSYKTPAGKKITITHTPCRWIALRSSPTRARSPRP